MSDPAMEAADRAWDSHDGPFWNQESADMGAREALAPIREIHKPMVMPNGKRQYCEDCTPEDPYYAVPWPCPTALLCYTTDEIKEMT